VKTLSPFLATRQRGDVGRHHHLAGGKGFAKRIVQFSDACSRALSHERPPEEKEVRHSFYHAKKNRPEVLELFVIGISRRRRKVEGAKFRNGHVVGLVELTFVLEESGVGSANNIRDFTRSVIERLAD
jgi:hypothetical protein